MQDLDSGIEFFFAASRTRVTREGIGVASSKWPQIQEMLNAGTIAVSSVGAACQEPGPQLVTNMTQSSRTTPVALVCRNGRSTHYRRTSCDGIKKASAARVILLNTSIRKNLPHESAIAACAYPHAYHLIYVSAGECFQCGVDVSSEQERGGHADEIETLMMVAVDEGVERLALAKSTPMQTASARFNRTNQTIRRMVLTVIRTWQRGKGRQFLASPTVVPLSKF